MTAGPKVFLNTIPKSGTHLAFKTLDLLGYRRLAGIKADLLLGPGRRARIRRLVWPLLPGRRFVVGSGFTVSMPLSQIARRARKADNGSYLHGHLGHDPALLQWILDQGFRVILMTRDPRAVLSSHVHHVMKRSDHPQHHYFSSLTLEERFWADFNGTPHGRAPLLSLSDRYRSVDAWMASDQVLKLRFEDLVGPNGGGSADRQHAELARLCAWLGIDQDRIEQVVENLFGDTNTFRRGQIDSWRNEVPPQVLREVERELAEFLVDWI